MFGWLENLKWWIDISSLFYYPTKLNFKYINLINKVVKETFNDFCVIWQSEHSRNWSSNATYRRRRSKYSHHDCKFQIQSTHFTCVMDTKLYILKSLNSWPKPAKWNACKSIKNSIWQAKTVVNSITIKLKFLSQRKVTMNFSRIAKIIWWVELYTMT